MPYRVLDLKFSPELGAIDCTPLERLVGACEVLQATEHFYLLDGVPHLVVAIHFRSAVPGTRRATPHGNPGRPVLGDSVERSNTEGTPASHWMEILGEGDRQLFEHLRAWRRKRAEADAVPPYVVLTNVQLAHIAHRRPSTLSALKEIEGVGNGRVEKFGQDLLDAMARALLPENETSGASAADPWLEVQEGGRA